MLNFSDLHPQWLFNQRTRKDTPQATHKPPFLKIQICNTSITSSWMNKTASWINPTARRCWTVTMIYLQNLSKIDFPLKQLPVTSRRSSRNILCLRPMRMLKFVEICQARSAITRTSKGSLWFWRDSRVSASAFSSVFFKFFWQMVVQQFLSLNIV